MIGSAGAMIAMRAVNNADATLPDWLATLFFMGAVLAGALFTGWFVSYLLYKR